MAAVFELVIDLFDPLMQGRIKEYSIGIQKGKPKALLCQLGETKCKCIHFLRESRSRLAAVSQPSAIAHAVFEACAMADLAPLSNLVFLLFHNVWATCARARGVFFPRFFGDLFRKRFHLVEKVSFDLQQKILSKTRTAHVTSFLRLAHFPATKMVTWLIITSFPRFPSITCTTFKQKKNTAAVNFSFDLSFSL